MAVQTNPTSGQKVPDPSTSYERAKPDVESPSKSLTKPETDQPEQKDKLASNARPASQKETE